MIIAGQLLIADDAGRCQVRPGYVRVDEETITEVVEGEIPETADLGGENALISPGFIDAHLHLPQFDIIGAHGLPLLRWLYEVTLPAESQWEDVDFAKRMTGRVISQLLSMGTTGICAFATVHHDSARAALEVAKDAGMRGVIGQALMDREAPPHLCRDADQLLGEAALLGELFPPAGRMAAAITPRFAVSCSEDLLVALGKLAVEQGSMIQSHLAETVDECERVRELFAGRSYVDVYQQTGLLRQRAVYGHGIHLNHDDRVKLRESEAVIAHCPTANSFLRSGTMDRAALLRDSVTLAIGSDIGAGYECSMVRVARAMIEAAASIGDDYPDCSAAWYAITAGNADALGWGDAGRLRAGAAADLLVIDPTIDWLDAADPLSMLMFAWDDRWLKRTMLRGRLWEA
jgi:guanine deaminase